MSDISLDILIRTLAETVGAEKVQAALDGVKESTDKSGQAHEEASKQVEKHEVSHRNLRSALHLLGPEFAEVGHLGLMAFANPMTAALVALAGTVALVKKAVAELGPEALAIGGSVSPSFDKIVEAAGAAEIELAKFQRQIDAGASAEKRLADNTAAAIAKIHEQQEAQAALDDAEKALDLAKLNAAREAGTVTGPQYEVRRQHIEDASRLRKDAREKQTRDVELAAMTDEQRRASAGAEDASGQVYGATEASTRAAEVLRQSEERISKAKARIEELKKIKPKTAAGQEAWNTAWNTYADIVAKGEAMLPEIKEDAAAAEAHLKKLQDDAQSLSKRADELDAKIKSARESNKLKTATGASVINTKRETGEIEGITKAKAVGPAAEDIRSSEEIAKALGKHQEVSEAAKQQLIDVASAIAGHAVDLKTAAAMMDAASKNIAIFNADVIRLAEKMVSLSGDHSNKLRWLHSQVDALWTSVRSKPGGG